MQRLLQQGRVDLQRVEEAGRGPEAGQLGHQEPGHPEAESSLPHAAQHHAHTSHHKLSDAEETKLNTETVFV